MKLSSHRPMNFRRVLTAAFALAASASVFAASYVDLRRIEPVHGDSAAGAQKAVVCVACHGPNGNAVVPAFPKLAGQHADYLYHRLAEYKAVDPKSPAYTASAMPALLTSLNDADFRDLAAYFAAQTASSAPAVAASSEGEALYMGGDPARGIPPCQGCHGSDASGPSVRTGHYAAYPALRGQHAAYVIARLQHYRDNLPHDSTNDFIMEGVARTLDDNSMQTIAAWLAALPAQKEQ